MLRAKKYAAQVLGARMQTCKEMEDKLRRKGCSEETVNLVMEEFCRAGFLNDRNYADLYILDAVNIGYKGFYRIRQELAQKGVARSIIDRALEETEADVYEKLCEYVRQRYEGAEIPSRRELEKIKVQLARRGYSPQEIRNSLDDCGIRITGED